MTGSIARRQRRDAGQAFPLYIVAVGGLLFLAFAFFVVGQAAATHNGAQTAADAAAVAAGQKYRAQLSKGLLAGLDDNSADGGDTAWEDLLGGRGIPSDAACRSADWFAEQNDAEVSACVPDSWPTSFAVTVRTRGTVGDSVIPGTESKHGAAKAKAVVVPRCALARTPSDDGRNKDAGTAGERSTTGPQGKSGKGKGQKPPPRKLTCDGKDWTLDPDKPLDLPKAADLFAVRLAN